jgi:hypothetical protein
LHSRSATVCELAHTSCPQTQEFTWLGQQVSMSGTSACGKLGTLCSTSNGATSSGCSAGRQRHAWRSHCFGAGAMDRRLCSTAGRIRLRARPSRSSIAGSKDASSAHPRSSPSSSVPALRALVPLSRAYRFSPPTWFTNQSNCYATTQLPIAVYEYTPMIGPGRSSSRSSGSLRTAHLNRNSGKNLNPRTKSRSGAML